MSKIAQRSRPLGQIIEFPPGRVRADASQKRAVGEADGDQQDVWLQRAQAGDPAAMRELYRVHAAGFLAFLVRLCGSAADAEDIAQDAFMTTFDRIRRVQPGRFRAFLHSVGVRKCQHLFRRRRLLIRLGFRSADAQIDQVARPDASPEDRAALADILRLVARLPAEQRVAWSLRRFEGYTNDETAKMCGCSVATIKRRIRAANEALAASIEECGHVE